MTLCSALNKQKQQEKHYHVTHFVCSSYRFYCASHSSTQFNSICIPFEIKNCTTHFHVKPSFVILCIGEV